jgi:hypothetical protein
MGNVGSNYRKTNFTKTFLTQKINEEKICCHPDHTLLFVHKGFIGETANKVRMATV